MLAFLLIAVLALASSAAPIHALAAGGPNPNPPRPLAIEDGVWEQFVIPPTPLSRVDHVAVYDSLGDRMIMIGSTPEGQTTVASLPLAGGSGTTYLHPQGTAPSVNESVQGVYDSARDRVILLNLSGAYPAVSTLELSPVLRWTVVLGYTPTTRSQFGACYDRAHDQVVVVCGGRTDVAVLHLSGTPTWESPRLNNPYPPGLPFRYDPAVVYDTARDQIVMAGGEDNNTSYPGTASLVWQFYTEDYTDLWGFWEIAPGSLPPNDRPEAIYDPVRDRVIALGGDYGSAVWAHDRASGVPAQLFPAGTPQSMPRVGCMLIYDAMRNRLVMHGGYYNGAYYPDTWALSLGGTPQWTLLEAWTNPPPPQPPQFPPGREGATMIHDPLRERVVLFGGADPNVGTGSYADTWTWDMVEGSNWVSLAASGPTARSFHSAVYDSRRDRMLVFGGLPLNHEVWALSLSGTPQWSLLQPSGTAPIARARHTAVYDSLRDRMIVFGGADSTILTYRDDVWSLDFSEAGATWNEMSPTGTKPQRREGHSAIYDPLRDRMVVFGGLNGNGQRNDLWSLSLNGAPAWTQLAEAQPPMARYDHTAIYDPGRDWMVVYGGRIGIDATTTSVSAYPLRGGSWRPLSPGGSPPASRSGHAAVYDPAAIRMVTFGGYNSNTHNYTQEIWSLVWGVWQVGVDEKTPGGVRLAPPHPNPSSGRVGISLTLDRSGDAEVEVLDLQGRRVAQLFRGELPPGQHEFAWGAGGTRGGIYWVRARALGETLTRRIVRTE